MNTGGALELKNICKWGFRSIMYFRMVKARTARCQERRVMWISRSLIIVFSWGPACCFVDAVVRNLAFSRAISDLTTACAALLATIRTLRVRAGAFRLEPLCQVG